MSVHSPDLKVRFATSPQDILAAQRLRYDVFVTELGGAGPSSDHTHQIEADAYDRHAKHLLLCDGDRVVGAYRLLDQDDAGQVGGFYTENEYDLTALRQTGQTLLELGRSCIHWDYRGGLGLLHLWSALADYVIEAQIDIVFGVASFHGADAAKHRDGLVHLAQEYLADEDIRPRSKRYLSMAGPRLAPAQKKAALAAMPSLIKSYLRLGGKVGDGAFVDHNFNTTDVCLLLDTNTMNARAGMVLPRAFSHE